MIAIAATLWLAVVQPATAAEPAPDAAAPAPPAAPAPEDACALVDAPVIEISGRVRARSLKFTQSGDTETRIWSEPGGEGRWELDRGPLPDPIPVGKTFRNIDVTLDARADLTAEGLTVSADAGPTAKAPAACN